MSFIDDVDDDDYSSESDDDSQNNSEPDVFIPPYNKEDNDDDDEDNDYAHNLESKQSQTSQTPLNTDTMVLDDNTANMLKFTKKLNIRHTALFCLDNNPSKQAITNYPTTWDMPCSVCDASFPTVPIFPPIHKATSREYWELSHFATCSLPCAKNAIMTEGGVSVPRRLSLLTSFASSYLGYDGNPIPHMDTYVLKQYKTAGKKPPGNCTAIVRNPPFMFVPTWIEQKKIEEFENEKKMKFHAIHSAKVTAEQQMIYENQLKRVKLNNTNKNSSTSVNKK